MNRAVPTFTIELDRERTGRLTAGALVQAEQLSGVNLGRVGVGDLDLGGITALLFACIAPDDPTLTLRRLREDILTPADLSTAYEVLTTAWIEAMPKPEAEKQDANAEEGEGDDPLEDERAAA